jgi:O-antigen/teichoic acid export membrane protein
MISLFILAKFSSPEEFGIISLMLAAAEILKVIADFGIDTLSVRDFAITRSKKKKNIIASNIALIKFISGVFFYIILFPIILFSKYSSHLLLGSIAGLLLITALWINLPINYFQSKLRMRELILPIFINFIFTIILIFSAVMAKANTLILLATIPFSEIISTFVLFLYLRKEIEIHKNNIFFFEIKNLLSRSWPIAITLVSAVLYTRLDIVVLGNFSNATEVGYYGIAYRITEPFLFIASAFAISIYSHVSSSITLEKKNIASVIKQSLGISVFYAFLASLSLVILSPYFISSFLPQYLPALPILNLLSLALVFRVINNCLTSIIQAYGKYAKITIVAFWNLCFNFFLIGLSIHNINAVKVAQILTVVECLNMIIQFFLLKRVLFKKQATLKI